MKRILALMAVSACAVLAQPNITAVQDGGAYTNNVAQGSVFVVKGTGLSAAGYSAATAPTYPTLISGVGITFTAVSGGNVVNALMVYLYNEGGVNQLAAVLPSNAATGAYDVRVRNGSATSNAFRTQVVARKPGIVTADGSGSGQAQATLSGDLILARNSNVGTIGLFTTRAARLGERVDLWGTGLGPDIAADTGGTSGDQTNAGAIRVLVNGTEVTPAFAGRSPGFPGLDQIVFTIPQNTTASCNVTIQVRAGGTLSNATSIPVAASGETCTNPNPGGGGGGTPTETEISTWINSGAFSYGSINIGRDTSHSVSVLGAVTTTKFSSFSAIFGRVAGLPTDLQKFLVPNIGQCTVLTLSAESLFPNLQFQYYDAGPQITASGPGGSMVATRAITTTPITTVTYDAGELPANRIVAGTYALNGPGGPNVGPFSGNLTVGPEIVWTNWEEAKTINRANGFTVRWSGANSSQYVSISGTSISDSGSAFVFTCLANRSAGSFSIPASILTQLPASPNFSGFSFPGFLSISGTTNGTRITASGVDFLTANDSSSESVTTTWQ